MALDKEAVVCLLYAIFLALQLLGMILYCIRAAVCCVQERALSYQCKNFTFFPYSLEIQLSWLILHLLNLGISLLVVSLSPAFLGYHRIYRKLLHLPNFWSFSGLLAVAVVDFILILSFHKKNRLQEAVVAAFLAENLITVLVVGVFNFTPLKELPQRLGSYSGVLIKITLILFFVTNCCVFLIGTFQLAFKVTGLDDNNLALNLSKDFKTMFRVFRNFAYVVFYLRATSFFWQKIFIDKRNILSHHQLLDSSNRRLSINI